MSISPGNGSSGNTVMDQEQQKLPEKLGRLWGISRDCSLLRTTDYMWMVRVREYFLREIGCWKTWIPADTVYKRTGPVSMTCRACHSSGASFTSHLWWAPKKRTPRATCRVGSFLWKPGLSPHQNCLEDNWASHLVSSEVIYVHAIFGVGKGNLTPLGALAGSLHLFSGVHWRAVAQLASLIFCIILTVLTQEQRMAHRIIKTFFHSIHGQPFISHLSQTVLPNH